MLKKYLCKDLRKILVFWGEIVRFRTHLTHKCVDFEKITIFSFVLLLVVWFEIIDEKRTNVRFACLRLARASRIILKCANIGKCKENAWNRLKIGRIGFYSRITHPDRGGDPIAAIHHYAALSLNFFIFS